MSAVLSSRLEQAASTWSRTRQSRRSLQAGPQPQSQASTSHLESPLRFPCPPSRAPVLLHTSELLPFRRYQLIAELRSSPQQHLVSSEAPTPASGLSDRTANLWLPGNADRDLYPMLS